MFHSSECVPPFLSRAEAEIQEQGKRDKKMGTVGAAGERQPRRPNIIYVVVLVLCVKFKVRFAERIGSSQPFYLVAGALLRTSPAVLSARPCLPAQHREYPTAHLPVLQTSPSSVPSPYLNRSQHTCAVSRILHPVFPGKMNSSTTETHLTGFTPCRFPTFHCPDQAVAASSRQIGSVRITLEQAGKLLELSITDEHELGAVLGTAWALLLQCYTGQDDVSFGFQHSGEGTVGPVVARFLLSGATSVVETVSRAKIDVFARPRVSTAALGSGNADHPLVDTAVVLWTLTKASAACPILPSVCHPMRIQGLSFPSMACQTR